MTPPFLVLFFVIRERHKSLHLQSGVDGMRHRLALIAASTGELWLSASCYR